MKSDLTRLTFDRAKHYRAVQQQQGRVQLDADWNEQLDITAARIETETVDTVGTCGAPLHADGFRLVAAAANLTADEKLRAGNTPVPAVAPGDLLLTAGRFYARGVLAENDHIALVSTQPDLPTTAQSTKLGAAPLFPLKAPGTYLAYLDVWPRLRTAIDDPGIREVALGGPDTATRIKNAWQVKFLAAPDGANCATPIPEWNALLKPKLGTLAASVAKTASKPSPCIVDPGAGYRRLENQLYRVEVHIGGDSLAKSTFKWSRDNGSIVTRWLKKEPLSDELEVETTGRDKVLNIAPGHWIELIDDAHEELGLPGTFALVTHVVGNVLTIDSANATGPVEFSDFPKNPKVRRWDSAPAKPGKWLAPDGEKTLNTVNTFELEDGVVVQFGTGGFRTGDYWLIPARTALPFVEWPTDAAGPIAQAPHGITHQYCKLGIVEFKAGAFKIHDCRSLFPPLTELTSLFYVSGDSQEATPNPTLPAATLLPLALPLKVGVANGEWPVAGALVRFTVKIGGGTLAPVDGLVSTDADGVASCAWSIDSTEPNPEVIAELLDPADTRVHLPIVFHARLNTAALVAYDPAKCEGMKNAAPPVVTVQDALDFLCHEKAGVECCVTIGKLGERPGDYETVAAAIEDLLRKRRQASICLALLPGDHLIEADLSIAPADEKSPTFFKIAGCSHGSRLIVKAPLIFKNLEAAVIRDISILIDGRGLHFDACREVEISSCLIKGRAAKSALLRFGQIPRLTIANNEIQAVDEARALSPEKLLANIPSLANAFASVDERDFEVQAAVVAEDLVKLAPRERTRLTKDLTTAFTAPGVELATEERKGFTNLVRTLATERPTAKTLLARFKAVRVTAALAPTGAAIALDDTAGARTLVDNRIAGVVSLGGLPDPKPLSLDELKRLGVMIGRGAVQLTLLDGTQHVRGNELLRFVAGDRLLTEIRNILADGRGSLALGRAAQWADNLLHQGGNFLAALHVTLTTTRQDDFTPEIASVIALRAIYIGNSASGDFDGGVKIFSVAPEGHTHAANQNIGIVAL